MSKYIYFVLQRRLGGYVSVLCVCVLCVFFQPHRIPMGLTVVCVCGFYFVFQPHHVLMGLAVGWVFCDFFSAGMD